MKHENLDLLKALLAFLNSSLPIFYIKEKYSSMTYNGGITFTKDMFNLMPFPKLSKTEKSNLINMADLQVSNHIKIQELSDKFFALLKGDFKDVSINSALTNWYDLDWTGFRAALKKQKINLIGEVKEDWYDRFERLSQQAKTIKSIIDTTDKQIDALVYKLYNLTDDEIRVINNN